MEVEVKVTGSPATGEVGEYVADADGARLITVMTRAAVSIVVSARVTCTRTV
jgi:hypothetical protein